MWLAFSTLFTATVWDLPDTACVNDRWARAPRKASVRQSVRPSCGPRLIDVAEAGAAKTPTSARMHQRRAICESRSSPSKHLGPVPIGPKISREPFQFHEGLLP